MPTIAKLMDQAFLGIQHRQLLAIIGQPAGILTVRAAFLAAPCRQADIVSVTRLERGPIAHHHQALARCK